LLVVAAGKAGLIRSGHVRPGAVVVDVGINRVTGPDGKAQTVGDVDPAVAEVAGAITPVPGGVGSLTTTILLESTVDAAERLAADGGAIDGAEVARLLGGLDLPAGAADRIATLLARHLVGVPAGATRPPLERRLAAISAGGGVVVLDGGISTALAEHGIDPARALEANLDRPQAVLAVHGAYLAAGAQVITANTFGASRRRCGSAEAAVRVVTAGLRLARQAAAGRALVLGSIAPLGPDVPAEDASESIAEVALALADGLADGILLETFTATPEAARALAAVRRVCRLPVMVSRHFERDDAVEIAEFARAMEAGGAVAVGVNCGNGPRALVPVVARLAASTRLPVLARPNAGQPVREDGRLRWHLRPAWLVEQARAYVAAGAGLVGGCCGVHAGHIRALAALAGMPVPPRAQAPALAPAVPVAPVEHPLLAAARGGGFPALALVPGRLPVGAAEDALGRLTRAGAAAVGLVAGWPGTQRGARLGARLRHLQDVCGRPALLDLAAGECPLAEAEERLLTAHLLGVRLVVVDDGVFSGGVRGEGADALALLALVRDLNRGRDRAGRRLEEPTAFTVGVRLRASGEAGHWKEAGADFLCLQPVYEPARFRAWMAAFDRSLPLFVDVLLLPDAATADELDNELPALSVPARLKERLAHDPGEDARGVGRFLAHWRDRLAGVCIHCPDARTAGAEALLATLRR
jgi:methionine synthase I (cobalamin-dependent)